jgi:hypothetical protein
MVSELMNETPGPRDAFVTITYEYIPNYPNFPSASDFQPLTPMWLDIGGCGHSEQPVPAGKMKFEYTSPPWTASISGRVMAVYSHLHDGGVEMEVFRGEERVCKVSPGYGERKEFVGHGHNHQHGSSHENGREEEKSTSDGEKLEVRSVEIREIEMKHISSIPSCMNLGRMEKGEEWTITARYDLKAHEPMDDGSGTPEPVMGIAIMYVVEE